jgi:hypothetical protein
VPESARRARRPPLSGCGSDSVAEDLFEVGCGQETLGGPQAAFAAKGCETLLYALVERTEARHQKALEQQALTSLEPFLEPFLKPFLEPFLEPSLKPLLTGLAECLIETVEALSLQEVSQREFMRGLAVEEGDHRHGVLENPRCFKDSVETKLERLAAARVNFDPLWAFEVDYPDPLRSRREQFSDLHLEVFLVLTSSDILDSEQGRTADPPGSIGDTDRDIGGSHGLVAEVETGIDASALDEGIGVDDLEGVSGTPGSISPDRCAIDCVPLREFVGVTRPDLVGVERAVGRAARAGHGDFV